MLSSHTATAVILTCACVGSVLASPYGGAPADNYAPSAPASVAIPPSGEAQAAANSDRAGARAAAAQVARFNFNELDRYGYEIGRPLLARPYGDFSNLYAAALPPRSFVGRIDPAFYRDSYGRISHVAETSIGVAAI